MSKKESKILKNNLSGLDKLAKNIREHYHVRIGILGQKSFRGEEDQEGKPVNNAELGVIHEFGSVKRNIPPRSFLRNTLATKNEEIVDDVLTKKKEIKEDMVDGDGSLLFKVIGVAAEGKVLDSFDSRGFGTWPALKRARKDGSNAPLVDTGQLKGAVTHDVRKGK